VTNRTSRWLFYVQFLQREGYVGYVQASNGWMEDDLSTMYVFMFFLFESILSFPSQKLIAYLFESIHFFPTNTYSLLILIHRDEQIPHSDWG